VSVIVRDFEPPGCHAGVLIVSSAQEFRHRAGNTRLHALLLTSGRTVGPTCDATVGCMPLQIAIINYRHEGHTTNPHDDIKLRMYG